MNADEFGDRLIERSLCSEQPRACRDRSASANCRRVSGHQCRPDLWLRPAQVGETFAESAPTTSISLAGARRVATSSVSRRISGRKVIRLERNYRSPAHPRRLHLIATTKRLGKTLFKTSRPRGAKVSWLVWNPEEEAAPSARSRAAPATGHSLMRWRSCPRLLRCVSRGSFRTPPDTGHRASLLRLPRIRADPRLFRATVTAGDDLAFARIVNVPAAASATTVASSTTAHGQRRSP